MMEQIGRYKIVGELGHGAMGIVYHAIDPAIGRSVAIKTIRIHDIADTQQRQKLRDRLFTEARSAGVLSHPNIVTIYDMDEVDDLAYIAMAYVNGPTLEKILASEEPLSGANMLHILRQSAYALDYAHSKNIVHRDVKPANIMTDEDGSVKITDFGIAKIAQPGTHSQTKTVVGTPNYMSPEQIQALAIDGRSDQFSLGVIAYEILTGERPFAGEHLSAIVYKIVREEPPPAHRINATLTPRIDEVLRKALSKNPEDRFPNCSNFVGALDLACAESRGWKTLPAGAAAAMPTVAVERSPRIEEPAPATEEKKRSSSRMLPFLVSALVVGGLAAVIVSKSGLVGGEDPIAVPSREQVTAVPEPTAEVKTEPLNEPKITPPINAPHAEVEPSPADAPPPEPAYRAQDIWVTTNPPGARAVLDGDSGPSCRTPCMLHGAPGIHRLSLSQAGYQTEHREVRVGNTAVDVPSVSMRQLTSTLMLTTQPSGANIQVNGEPIPQKTPTQLSLPPGTYTITVEKDGQSKREIVRLGESMMLLTIPLQ